MAQHRKQWHQLTPAARDRATRQAAKDYGLSRKQARERYNRGTYKPFAKEPVNRIPKNSPRLPIALGRTLKDAAIKNMDKHLGNSFQYNRFAVLDAIENHASLEALQRMAGASKDELITWAAAQKNRAKPSQPEKGTPSWLKNLGWTDGRNWKNVFWYH